MGKKVIPLAVFREYQERNKPTQTVYIVKARDSHSPQRCKHERIELDMENMQCHCLDCDKIVHPFWVLYEYYQLSRVTKLRLAECNAAIEEFNKIQEEWSLTQAERRRIDKAKERARRLDSMENRHA